LGEGSFLLMCGRLGGRVMLKIWEGEKIAAFLPILLLLVNC